MADDGVKLKPNDNVTRKYKVVQVLGEGSFGAVYEVAEVKFSWKRCWCVKTGEHRALKAEPSDATEKLLKLDAHAMKELWKANKNPQHLCNLFSTGKANGFSFIVMTLLGPSLHALRKCMPERRFTISTAIRVVKQCVAALQEVHDGGFIHRDVKPQNFAIGATPQTSRTVYVFDFGLARQYLFSSGGSSTMRKARKSAGFRGTVKYASPAAHEDKELGRQDDLISVLYMFVEMVSGHLAWEELQEEGEGDMEMKAVYRCKVQVSHRLYSPHEPALHKIHSYLSNLTYEDRPDYSYIYQTLNKIIAERKFNKDVYDWETVEVAAALAAVHPIKLSVSARGGDSPKPPSGMMQRALQMKDQAASGFALTYEEWFGPRKPKP